MSNAVLPTLPGLEWEVRQTPTFSTDVHASLSGKEVAYQYMQYPVWEFETSYEFLRAGAELELQTLCGFFLVHGGRFDTWLYAG